MPAGAGPAGLGARAGAGIGRVGDARGSSAGTRATTAGAGAGAAGAAGAAQGVPRRRGERITSGGLLRALVGYRRRDRTGHPPGYESV